MSISFDVAGQLFPNLTTMIVQWLSTGVLLFFVVKYLWKPARDFINKRAEYSQSQIDEANKLKEDAKALNEEAKAQIKEASITAGNIIDSAKNEGLQLKDSIVESAKMEAKSKLEEARKEIAYEKRQIQNEVKQEIVDVALAACEKLMSDKVLNEDDRKAVEEFVANSK